MNIENLKENEFEDAFADLMMILMCQNNEIFDYVACDRDYFEFRGHKFDLRKVNSCWKQYLIQNIRIEAGEKNE